MSLKRSHIVIIGVLIGVVCISVVLFLSNRSGVSYDRHIAGVQQLYQTSTQDNDPHYSGLISGIRTGGRRDISNLSSGEFEYTDSGTYITGTNMHLFANVTSVPTTGGGSMLFYVEHDSDTVIKLCGRADCRHDTDQCNAYLMQSLGITYYDGYLYYCTIDFSSTAIASLYRMNVDGSNHVKILDCSELADKGYDGFWDPRFINGMFIVGLSKLDKETEMPVIDWYYCKLDGSKHELKQTTAGYCWTDGEALLHGSPTMDDSGTIIQWDLLQWDPDSNTETVLNTVTGVEDVSKIMYNTYWGTKCGLRHENGKVIKINYPNTEMEVLFETGILGNATGDFYPDCIAIHEKGDYQNGVDSVLYFFDYQGNKLGQVTIDIPVNCDFLPIIGECRDRIYIRGNMLFTLPTHYIDKSEFGSGELVLHPLEYPDLKDFEREFVFSDMGMEGYEAYGELYDSKNYGAVS